MRYCSFWLVSPFCSVRPLTSSLLPQSRSFSQLLLELILGSRNLRTRFLCFFRSSRSWLWCLARYQTSWKFRKVQNLSYHWVNETKTDCFLGVPTSAECSACRSMCWLPVGCTNWLESWIFSNLEEESQTGTVQLHSCNSNAGLRYILSEKCSW